MNDITIFIIGLGIVAAFIMISLGIKFLCRRYLQRCREHEYNE